MLTVGSLFAGIGGFDLGFERAGMRTAWFCEQNEFCQRVLAKHWPGVPCYPDVRRIKSAEQFQRHGFGQPVERVDVLCGGFPCQDLSYAGKGAGLDGERSGLWSEYARIVGELRPRYVVVENVPALLGRGLGRVLGDLAAIGYDAEWDCLPASAFGAPHRRDRLWLVAYPGSVEHEGSSDAERRATPQGFLASHPDADGGRLQERGERDCGKERPGLATSQRRDADGLREAVADANGSARSSARGTGEAVLEPEAIERSGRRGGGEGRAWAVEPDVGRVAHGVPARVDRLAALGNALVPQIAQWIGERIIEWEEGELAA